MLILIELTFIRKIVKNILMLLNIYVKTQIFKLQTTFF